MNQLDRIDIGEGEQKRADGSSGRRDREMPHREAQKSEISDHREHGHRQHVGGEHVRAEGAERGMHRADQKQRIGVAERAALRIEEQRVGPICRAGENMPPMLDNGQREIAVRFIAECAVEAVEQPVPERPCKAGRE